MILNKNMEKYSQKVIMNNVITDLMMIEMMMKFIKDDCTIFDYGDEMYINYNLLKIKKALFINKIK